MGEVVYRQMELLLLDLRGQTGGGEREGSLVLGCVSSGGIYFGDYGVESGCCGLAAVVAREWIGSLVFVCLEVMYSVFRV